MILLPPDFKEFLQLLNSNKVEYLLIGGYAVGYCGYPRATADMDIWVNATPQNAERLVGVFVSFGFKFNSEAVMYTSIIPIIASLLMYLPMFADVTQQSPNEPLTVIVKAAETQKAGSGIRLTIEIINNTGSDFELSVREKEPPFFLKIVNEKGWDLTQNELARKAMKDRSQKNVSLVFKPHERKTYQATFSKYLDDDGKEKPVPAGEYKVSGLVGILSYTQGAYKVKLVESNQIKVTLN